VRTMLNELRPIVCTIRTGAANGRRNPRTLVGGALTRTGRYVVESRVADERTTISSLM
jgi:hypothetical protein